MLSWVNGTLAIVISFCLYKMVFRNILDFHIPTIWPVDYDGKPAAKKKLEIKVSASSLIRAMKNRVIETLEDQAQLTTLYTEYAVDFINRNKKNPFFLYLAHSMTHVPLAVSDKFKGKVSRDFMVML